MTDTITITPQTFAAMFTAADGTALTREERRARAERRRNLLADYLLAAEEAEEHPSDANRATFDETRQALAAFLAETGEYPTAEAAAEAADARCLWGIPRPDVDYSGVPF
jgi:hypothetical protein